MSVPSDAAFAKQIQVHVRDLLRPHPTVFWADMLLCALLGHTGLVLYLTSPVSSPLAWAGFLVSVLAYYRGMMFIHELAHLKRGTFGAFRAVWNLLLGIPLQTPSFLYAEHRTHHTNHSYGTQGDAEYYPIGRGPVGLLLWFVGQGFLMPILAVLRFAVLAPVSLLHPRLRAWVWQRASGLTQNNPHFRRPWPKGREWFYWGLQEAGCTLFCWTVLALMIAGVLPWVWLAKGYVLFSAMTLISYTRALASHLYYNDYQQLTYIEQMFDSTTVPGHPLLTEMWAPLGQRYHALHHLIPSIPYHSLGIAHRRLMQVLPEDSPYRRTIRPNLWSTLAEIWQQASRDENRRARRTSSAA